MTWAQTWTSPSCGPSWPSWIQAALRPLAERLGAANRRLRIKLDDWRRGWAVLFLVVTAAA